MPPSLLKNKQKKNTQKNQTTTTNKYLQPQLYPGKIHKQGRLPAKSSNRQEISTLQ